MLLMTHLIWAQDIFQTEKLGFKLGALAGLNVQAIGTGHSMVEKDLSAQFL